MTDGDKDHENTIRTTPVATAHPVSATSTSSSNTTAAAQDSNAGNLEQLFVGF